MPSLEEINKRCLVVCQVPVELSKDILINHVKRHFRYGRILDTDKVDEIESRTEFTRFVLLCSSAEDVEYICREVKGEEIQIKDSCVQLKYQKAKVCELPDRWVDFQEPEQDKMQPSTSAGSIQEPQQSHVRPEKPPDQPKPTGGNQQQLPRNVWPAGPYGPMSGIYQNIPLYSEGAGNSNQKMKQDGMPQHLPIYGHGKCQSPTQEKDSKDHHPTFTGHDQSLGHGPAHGPHQTVHPSQNFPFGRGHCPPGFPLFAMPGNYQIGQQNVTGGQKIPFQPRMPIPMFIDPQTGQMLPFPVAGFPKNPHQQADAVGAQRQRPTGQAPSYDGVVIKDQNQCYSTDAKSTTDTFCADGHQPDAMNEDLKDRRTEEPGVPEEKPRKIMVTNLPSTLHEGYLEMYFENARKCGGDVTVVNVDLDEDNTTAIVEFDEPEGVDVILSKCPLIMMGKEVEVTVYRPEPSVPLCSIEVTGPCSVVSEEQLEMLEMYFESERRSGGGDIVISKFDSEMNMALITFEREEVAKRVEERGTHIIKKDRIKVSLHSPTKQPKRSDETENVENKANTPKAIKVTGVGKLASKDTVEFYFENSRRSGGGEIESIKCDEEDEDAIYITFKSKQDAISVVNRGIHTVEGKELNVSLYVPPVSPPSYENKILIKGVKPTTTQDCLFNFIEAKTEYSPETMDYHAEQEDVVMVNFKDKPDIQELEKIFGKNKLEGASLKVYPVPISNCIIVTNLTSDITEDTVSFYFENTRKSGGGQVDKVVMNEDDTCLVYFADYTTIDRVIDRKHELSKQKLDVKRYQECLGRPEGTFCERKLIIPEPLKMKNVSLHKLKLLKHSKFCQEALEKELLNCHARVLLPTDGGDVTLKCTLTKDVETCFKLVKTWEKGAKECFDHFINTISVHQIRVLQDVWEKVVERLKSITIKSPETVAVFVDENDRYVTVVGDKTPAESHAKKLQKVVEEAEMEQQQVKETFNSLKSMETKLLLAGKFPSKVEEMFPELKVKINLEENEIVFEGSLANVRDAKLKLYEVKSEYAQKSIENISTHSAELFKDKHTKHYIVKKLKMQRVTGVWEIQDHTLIIISSSEQTIDHCVSIIRESVVEKSIRLTKASTSVMNSEAWQRKVENLHSQHYGKAHITVDDSMTEVVICSTDDIANEILDGVKSFLGSNVVLEEAVQCNKYLHKLVEKHHKNAISEICKQLRSYHVTITSEEYGGCRICGTEDGIIRSKELLKKLFDKVKQKDHKAVKSGVVKETKKHSGQEDFSTTENSMLHIISVKDEWDEGEQTSETLYDRNPAGKENGNKAIKVRASCKAYGNRNVYTAVGDVTDMPVQVLVYAADEKRSPSDGLGKAMVLRGKLKADYIIHVIGPVWGGGVNNEEEKLEETAFKCMQEATTNDATSIALPAISCGAFGYPVKQGTRSIVKAVKNFFHEVQESQLTDIYLCDVKSNIVDSFTDELQNEFGEIHIEEQSEDLHQRMAEMGSDDINDVSMYTRSSRLKKSPQGAVREAELQHQVMGEEQEEEPKKPTKIVVSNLPSTAHKEYLEMIFENKRKFGDGISVSHIDFDEDTSTAVVEFNETEAVDIVLGKCPIKLMGQEVEVAVYKPETPVPLCTIEVTGPYSAVCKEQLDTLEIYFDSERRSGGGDVVDCKFDSENNMVLVTFEKEEVAKRVEERATHVLKKEKLTVKLHIPTKQSKKSVKVEEDKEDEPEKSKTIKVKGVDKSASIDTVEFYFENSRRSGGGEIEEIKSDEEDEDVIYITFKDTQAAEKVASRGNHQIEGKQLKVSLYVAPVPPPSYDNKILIKGLKPTTTQDCLFNFIEAKTEFIPDAMDYHAEQEDVVMVTFTDNPDFQKLEKVFGKSKLEGASLKVYPVPISNCIIVANLVSEVTKDTVEFYFENTRKSGGGQVEKVVMNEDDTCLVYFADFTLIDGVLEKKHKLGGHTLDVKRYQECLGRPEGEIAERTLRIPEDVVLKDVDSQKIKFMKHSNVNRSALETQLGQCYTNITWPEDSGYVVLTCTLTKEVKDCFKLVKQWKETAEQNFKDFMKNIIVSKVPVLQDIWYKVMEELQSVTIENPEAVAIFVDKIESIITVEGNKLVAEGLSKKIDDITKKVMTEVEKEREKIKEVFTALKLIETSMLLADKFPTEMEKFFPDLKVKINQNKNEIVFEGPLGQVRDAKLKMYEMKNRFATASIDKVSTLAAGLFLLKQTKEHVVKKLKASRLTAVWDITDGCLVVYSTSDEQIQKCVNIIRGSVIENTIGLKKASKTVVNSENWQTKVDELHAYNPGKCVIKVPEDASKVQICATDDIAMDILENVQKFLRLNTVTEVKVPCTKNAHRLIERHYKNELQNIAKSLQHSHVQIVSIHGYGGFEVHGTEDGIQEARAKMSSLLQRVQQREHTLSKPGLAKHMQTPKGKDNLNTIESTLECVVSVKDGDDAEDSFDSTYDTVPVDSGVIGNIGIKGLTIIGYCKAYDCRNIYTAEGDMTELNVDMIVNSADDKLSLTGGLGKAIVQKGGKEIQKECNDYIRTEGRLDDGDAYVSTAGNLKADFIVHVRGPVWRGGRNKEDEMLSEAVFKCLQQASARNLTSVAMPAISCGTYGYPVRKATSTIVEAVKNFFREVQESTVTDIYLCDMKLNTVDTFNEGLKNAFGETNFQKYVTKQNNGRPHPAQRKPRNVSSDDEDYEEPIRPMDTDEEEDDYYSRRKPPPLPKGRPSQRIESGASVGNISVSVVKGEIAKQKVDVMVNTTAKNLDLKNGAVSASLLKSAGAELQQEVSGKYPSGIKDGEIAVTSGQKLNCDIVIHSSMMNWDGSKDEICKKALHKLVKDCMNEAEKQNKSSIAFPAIGTGNLGFPRDVVASEMLTAVSKFAESNPASNVKDVRFIVYQKDLQTIQAFEAEVERWSSGKRGGGRQTRKFDVYEDLLQGRGKGRTSSDDKDNADEEHIYDRVTGDNDDNNDDDDDVYDDVGGGNGVYKFGSITVSVHQGDITAEKADCIVNSSNEALDLSRGKVSQALMKKGGKGLAAEVDKLKKKMKSDGIVVTSAPGLQCKHIIHIVAKETAHEWKEMIEKCLDTADKNKMKSIAFPALGTGIQMVASDMAETMTKALIQFEKSQPSSIQEVRLVIFQQKMVEDFNEAIRKTIKSKEGWGVGKLVKSVQGWWNGKEANRKGDVQYKRTKVKKKPPIQTDPNTVTFIILALSENIINQAIRKLESCLDKEIHSKRFDDSIIMKMDDNQVMEIRAIAQQFHIEMQLESAKGNIQISGIASNVMSASDKIHRIMRDAVALEQAKNSAALMSNLVQWSYIEIGETDQTLQPYDKDLNYKIENAYIAKAPNVKFSANNTKYVLDFGKMEEYPEDDAKDFVTVLRRDLVKQGAFEQPALWADMNGNLRVVVLQTTSQEYLDVSQNFAASSGPGFTVVKVERVQNKTLWAQYQAKKKQLDDQNPPNTTNEKLLWHGTAVETVDNINAHGFNRSYCGKNATMYGDGVYFAVNAQYSCRKTYSRPDTSGVQRMYYCRVLTGEYTQGKQGMRVTPNKGGAGSTALYDSVVDNPGGPGMFIIFHDTQAYPEYLVSFKPQ